MEEKDAKVELKAKMARLSAFIREARDRQNMTRAELAKKLGYKWPNFIGMLEVGSAEFPMDKWEDFAEALMVPKHKFLNLVLEARYPRMLDYLEFRPKKKESGPASE